MSPHAQLGPRAGVFIFYLVGMTSGGDAWHWRALLAYRMSWEVGWSQALTKVLMAALVGLSHSGRERAWPILMWM